jgi:hypothetical protein
VSGGEARRRLEAAGYVLAPSGSGKRFWVQPETGKRLPEDHALAALYEKERRLLAEAGWEHVEIEGEAYWRRPDTGRLYPRGPALEVVRAQEERDVWQ